MVRGCSGGPTDLAMKVHGKKEKPQEKVSFTTLMATSMRAPFCTTSLTVKEQLYMQMAINTQAIGFKELPAAKEFINNITVVLMKETSLLARNMDTAGFNGRIGAIMREDGFRMLTLARVPSAGLMGGPTKGSGRTV